MNYYLKMQGIAGIIAVLGVVFAYAPNADAQSCGRTPVRVRYYSSCGSSSRSHHTPTYHSSHRSSSGTACRTYRHSPSRYYHSTPVYRTHHSTPCYRPTYTSCQTPRRSTYRSSGCGTYYSTPHYRSHTPYHYTPRHTTYTRPSRTSTYHYHSTPSYRPCSSYRTYGRSGGMVTVRLSGISLGVSW